MSIDLLLTQFERVSDAPDSIPRLRRFILDLAVHGKLVDQDPLDSSAELLIDQIATGHRETPLSPKHRSIVESPILVPPFDLPRLWAWTRLGRLADYIQRGKSPKYSTTTGPLVVSQKCIRWEGLDLGPARSITPKSLDAYEPVRFLRDGDLLWNSTGTGTIGRISRVVAPPARLVCDSHVTVVRCSQVDPEFIRCWLRSDYVFGTIEGEASGSTNQVELTLRMALSQMIPLPPLAEQHRIVAKVDELMGLCDQLEAAQKERELRRDSLRSVSLHRLTAVDGAPADVMFFLDKSSRLITQPEHVVAVRQTILDLAVRGRLVPQDPGDEPAAELLRRLAASDTTTKRRAGGKTTPSDFANIAPHELPTGWCWASLRSLGPTQTGGTPPTQNRGLYGDEVPFIKPGAITDARIDYNRPGLSRAGALALGRTGPAGTVLMVCIGASLGKCGLVDRRCSFNQQINSVSPRAPLEAEYVFLALRSPMFQRAAFAASAHGTLPILNKGRWGQLLIPIPPLAEQRRIVARVDELMVLCDELGTSMASAREARSQLLESLLGEALAASGDRAFVGDFASAL